MSKPDEPGARPRAEENATMGHVTDIFGGVADESRQRRNGHFWVGLDTKIEHCMHCRYSPAAAPTKCPGPPYCTVCGEHLDAHHDSSRADFEKALAALRPVVDDATYERAKEAMFRDRPPKKDHTFVRAPPKMTDRETPSP